MSNGNVLVASLGSHGGTVVGDEASLGVPRTGVTRGRGANPLRVYRPRVYRPILCRARGKDDGETKCIWRLGYLSRSYQSSALCTPH